LPWPQAATLTIELQLAMKMPVTSCRRVGRANAARIESFVIVPPSRLPAVQAWKHTARTKFKTWWNSATDEAALKRD
jgi:hypothetical protein